MNRSSDVLPPEGCTRQNLMCDGREELPRVQVREWCVGFFFSLPLFSAAGFICGELTSPFWLLLSFNRKPTNTSP